MAQTKAHDTRELSPAPEAGPREDIADAGEIAGMRQDDFERDVWCLLGAPIDIFTIDQAVAAIMDAVKTRRRLAFVTPNVNWLTRAARDPAHRREMIEADLSLTDGAPLAWMARRLGIPVRSRVAGSDLFEALRRRPAYAGEKIKVYFFGGRDGAAEAAARAVNDDAGGLRAVGWRNPGFGSVKSMSGADIIDDINAADPDFIVVALGAGKGQAWIHRNQSLLRAPVIAHLGAVIDFTAGGVKRAPRWVRKAGFEWAWRIKEEPALWRRYFQDGLALSRIILTKLMPQLNRAVAIAREEQGDAVVEASPTIASVRLSGALGRAGLRPVRNAFRQAAAPGGDIRLDFSGLHAFDRAFLGLVLVLEKHVVRNGGELFVDGASKAHQKILRANMMQYPSTKMKARSTSTGEAARTTAREGVRKSGLGS